MSTAVAEQQETKAKKRTGVNGKWAYLEFLSLEFIPEDHPAPRVDPSKAIRLLIYLVHEYGQPDGSIFPHAAASLADGIPGMNERTARRYRDWWVECGLAEKEGQALKRLTYPDGRNWWATRTRAAGAPHPGQVARITKRASRPGSVNGPAESGPGGPDRENGRHAADQRQQNESGPGGPTYTRSSFGASSSHNASAARAAVVTSQDRSEETTRRSPENTTPSGLRGTPPIGGVHGSDRSRSPQGTTAQSENFTRSSPRVTTPSAKGNSRHGRDCDCRTCKAHGAHILQIPGTDDQASIERGDVFGEVCHFCADVAAAVLDRQAEEGEPEPEPQAHEGDLWAIEVPDLEPANAWQQPTSTVTSNACQCDPETGFRDPWCDKPEHEGIVSAEPAAEQPAERAESNADAVTADPAPDDTYDDAEPFSIDDDDDTYPPDTLMARLADKFAEPIPTGPDDDRCEYCGEKFATDEEPFHPECQRRAYQGAA